VPNGGPGQHRDLKESLIAGKYRVTRVLGEGRTCLVVEAENVTLPKRVAIKILRPDLARSPDEVSWFLRRARFSGMLVESEHVTGVVDLGALDDGAPFIVMELLEGATLAKVLETGGPLSIEDAVGAVLQVCELMAQAHARGVVHCDLQPGKLFLTRRADGTPLVKVLDFAIARMVAGGGAEALADADGAVLSSQQTIADQQFAPPTDVYSLGISLYQLLTGVLPFEGNTEAELTAAILYAEPRPARELRADVPEALAAVMEKAYARDREARYQSIDELMTALAPFAPARPEPRAAAGAAAGFEWTSRGVVIAGVAIVMCAVAVVLMMR
jgi:serine/threonine protein kinase